jgi:hypothetical protein
MAALAYRQTPQAAQIHRVLEGTPVVLQCFQLLLLVVAALVPIILLVLGPGAAAAVLALILPERKAAEFLAKAILAVLEMAVVLVD